MKNSHKSTKSSDLRIRLSPHYKSKLSSYASAHGKTVSEVIRDYIRRLPDKTKNSNFNSEETFVNKVITSSASSRKVSHKKSFRRSQFWRIDPCPNCGSEVCFYHQNIKDYMCIECREMRLYSDPYELVTDEKEFKKLDEYAVALDLQLEEMDAENVED